MRFYVCRLYPSFFITLEVKTEKFQKYLVFHLKTRNPLYFNVNITFIKNDHVSKTKRIMTFCILQISNIAFNRIQEKSLIYFYSLSINMV